MASRLLALSGGDHTTLADWAAWVTNPVNFGTSGNWNDPTNGGDQILRVANTAFSFGAQQALSINALVTATYYKVTIRPNTEGGVTEVGAKVAADGTLNVSSVSKTPSFGFTGSHQVILDISGTTAVEWTIQGIGFFPGQHRMGAVRLPTSTTRNIYFDRCILVDRSGGNIACIWEGPTTAGSGRAYFRSCVIDARDSSFGGPITGNGSGTYFLGCTIQLQAGTSTAFHVTGTNVSPLYVYGCAIYAIDAGSATYSGTNASAANFQQNYNVSNITGAAWTDDFTGAGNVSNSPIPEMFVGAADQYPKNPAGSLLGVVNWSGLPPGVQSVWPDKDFLGTTITRSGTFSAGAICLSASTPRRPFIFRH